jgi:hypothetical protein
MRAPPGDSDGPQPEGPGSAPAEPAAAKQPDPSTSVTHAHDAAGDLAAARAALAGRDRFALDDEDETLCSQCLRRPRAGRWEWCRACLLDLTASQNRRHAADLRLPPLDRGPS